MSKKRYFEIWNDSTNELVFNSQKSSDINKGLKTFLNLAKIKPFSEEYEKITKIKFKKANKKNEALKLTTGQGVLSFLTYEKKPKRQVEEKNEMFEKAYKSYYGFEFNQKEKKEENKKTKSEQNKKETIFLLDFFIKNVEYNGKKKSKIEQMQLLDVNTDIYYFFNNFHEFDVFFSDKKNLLVYVNNFSVFFTFLKNSTFFKQGFLTCCASGKKNGTSYEVLNAEFCNNIFFKSFSKFDNIDTNVWGFSSFSQMFFFENVKKNKDILTLEFPTPLNLFFKKSKKKFDNVSKKAAFLFCQRENKQICENWELLKKLNYNGFLYINPLYQFKLLNNVLIYDLKKAYPSIAMSRAFPYEWKKTEEDEEFKQNFAVLQTYKYINEEIEVIAENDFTQESLNKYNFEKFKQLNAKNQAFFLNQISKRYNLSNDFFVDFFLKNKVHLFPVHYIGDFVLLNVKLKKNGLPFLQKTKNTNIRFEGAIFENCSLKKAEKIYITSSEVFIFLLLQNYDFTIFKISKLIYTEKAQPKNPFRRCLIEECLKNEDSKSLVNSISFGNEIKGCRGYRNYDYNKNIDEFYLKNSVDYPELKNYYTHFTDGIYTVDFNKVCEFALFRFLEKKADELIYADTDSLVFFDFKNEEKKINEFNKKMQSKKASALNIGFYKSQKLKHAKFINYKSYFGITKKSQKIDIIKNAGVNNELLTKKIYNYQSQNKIKSYEMLKKYITPFTKIKGEEVNYYTLKNFEHFSGLFGEKGEQSGAVKSYKTFSFFSFEQLADFRYFLFVERKQNKKYSKKIIYL